jgi:hypothetical protein
MDGTGGQFFSSFFETHAAKNPRSFECVVSLKLDVTNEPTTNARERESGGS